LVIDNAGTAWAFAAAGAVGALAALVALATRRRAAVAEPANA
jgi:hypothetical protein